MAEPAPEPEPRAVPASVTASPPVPTSITASYYYLPVVLRVLLIITGVSPWLVPIARAYLPLGQAGAALDLVFLPMCHRLPERTIELSGVLMPLCSRCAGVFAGVAIGALLAWPRMGMSAWRWVLGIAAAFMIMEVATQDLGMHPIFHPTRIATGVLLGYAMAASCVTNLWPLSARTDLASGAAPPSPKAAPASRETAE